MRERNRQRIYSQVMEIDFDSPFVHELLTLK